MFHPSQRAGYKGGYIWGVFFQDNHGRVGMQKATTLLMYYQEAKVEKARG
jgi:hypothetical protein